MGVVRLLTDEERQERIDSIRRAAIPVFAANGYRGTSMAQIAAAAGVSRAALYQFFDNRADLFRVAFEAVLNDATDSALAALDAGGTLAEQLDGYLQSLHGNAHEALATTPFGAELMEARHEFAADVAQAAQDRAHQGLQQFLEKRAGPNSAAVAATIDLTTLAPIGLKHDNPTTAAYRQRLTSLAHAASGLLEHD